MVNLSPSVLGFIRGVGSVIVFAVVSYLANAANLHGIMNDGLATLIAGVALMVEHEMQTSGTGALFGIAAPRP